MIQCDESGVYLQHPVHTGMDGPVQGAQVAEVKLRANSRTIG